MVRKFNKWLLVLSVALFSYIGFLLVTFPAVTAWHLVKSSQLPIQFSGISGSIWSGSAETMSVSSGKGIVTFPDVRWQLNPQALLKGELYINLQIGSATLPLEASGNIVATQNSLELNTTVVTTSAQWIINRMGNQIPGQVTGNVTIQLNKLVLTKQGCTEFSGNGVFKESQFIGVLGRFDLGNSTAEFSCKNHEIVANIQQRSAMLKSEGNFKMNIQRNYTFVGNVLPDASLPKSTKRLFQLLGQPDDNGYIPVRFYGRL
ncbi:type II secretion system protein N [Endozoicomonas ascidiicola]|uniref:type II secretion system protein N n=1 Tax=Endozoicomonas ascidiicola TaxID=1698521 RepID=UPI000A4EEC7D|nr:type II secretion system protein N [Endozoicomonas ascidiicola]